MNFVSLYTERGNALDDGVCLPALFLHTFKRNLARGAGGRGGRNNRKQQAFVVSIFFFSQGNANNCVLNNGKLILEKRQI